MTTLKVQLAQLVGTKRYYPSVPDDAHRLSLELLVTSEPGKGGVLIMQTVAVLHWHNGYTLSSTSNATSLGYGPWTPRKAKPAVTKKAAAKKVAGKTRKPRKDKGTKGADNAKD